MTLIAILLSLWADRRFPDYVDLRQFSLFGLYARIAMRFGAPGSGSWLHYVLLTALPACVVMIVINIIGFFPPLDMLLWALALYLCLPSEPLGPRVEAYLQAIRSGSEEQAAQRAEALLESPAPTGDRARDEAVIRHLFSGTTLHVVSLFTWFFLLGIGGAFFYRLNWQLYHARASLLANRPALTRQVVYAMGLLSWVPARLLVLTYAVVGKFAPAMAARQQGEAAAGDRHTANHALAARSGLASVGFGADTLFDDEHVEATWKRVVRAARALLVLAALVTLYGWL